MIVPTLAVHLSDGILIWPWLLLGFAASACLVAGASMRIADEEIPRIGLLTAAFFVASLIHVRVGPTSVHLLFNGLVGIVLGGRAVLAIAVGLLLQAFLLGHGGYYTLGLNCCIIAIPALFARPIFRRLSGTNRYPSFRYRDGGLALATILYPLLTLPLLFAVALGIRRQWQWSSDADFRAGFAVGAGCVSATAILNALLLVVAGTEDWHVVAVLVLAAHIPIAFIEGLIVGCTASFLRRVKPEMLGA